MEFKETETKSNKLIVTIKLITMIMSMFNWKISLEVLYESVKGDDIG